MEDYKGLINPGNCDWTVLSVTEHYPTSREILDDVASMLRSLDEQPGFYFIVHPTLLRKFKRAYCDPFGVKIPYVVSDQALSRVQVKFPRSKKKCIRKKWRKKERSYMYRPIMLSIPHGAIGLQTGKHPDRKIYDDLW